MSMYTHLSYIRPTYVVVREQVVEVSSLPITWIPGSKLGLLGVIANAFTSWFISPARNSGPLALLPECLLRHTVMTSADLQAGIHLEAPFSA